MTTPALRAALVAAALAAPVSCGAFTADSSPTGPSDASAPSPDASDASSTSSSASSSGGGDGSCASCPVLVGKVGGTIRGLTVAPVGVVLAEGVPDSLRVMPPGASARVEDIRGFESPFGEVHAVRWDEGGARFHFGTTTADFAGTFGVYGLKDLASEAARLTRAAFACRDFVLAQTKTFCSAGLTSIVREAGANVDMAWATSPAPIRYLATDGETVFWTTSAGVFTLGVNAAAGAGTAIDGASYFGIAAHADALYLLDEGGVVMLRKGGVVKAISGPYGSNAPPGPLAVAPDGKRIVWARGGEVWSAPVP